MLRSSWRGEKGCCARVERSFAGASAGLCCPSQPHTAVAQAAREQQKVAVTKSTSPGSAERVRHANGRTEQAARASHLPPSLPFCTRRPFKRQLQGSRNCSKPGLCWHSSPGGAATDRRSRSQLPAESAACCQAESRSEQQRTGRSRPRGAATHRGRRIGWALAALLVLAAGRSDRP